MPRLLNALEFVGINVFVCERCQYGKVIIHEGAEPFLVSEQYSHISKDIMANIVIMNAMARINNTNSFLVGAAICFTFCSFFIPLFVSKLFLFRW